MITLLLQPVYIFFLAILQITFLEFFSIGTISIDIAFLFVIYAGLWLNTVRGATLSLLLGFFIDCTVSPIWGLHMFLYVLFFYISMMTSAKINRENNLPISLFAGICLFLQGALKVLLYWLILDTNILSALPEIFLPQAAAAGILSPIFFNIFNYFEVFFNAEVRQPARRL